MGAGVGHGLEPVKLSWQGRCGGGGGGGVGGVGGEGGEGAEGWAWTGACKTLLFMAEALEGGGKCERWAVRAVRAVWAVRAAGVGHGLEPVKHCFSWQGRWRGGASASGGGGLGMDWEPYWSP